MVVIWLSAAVAVAAAASGGVSGVSIDTISAWGGLNVLFVFHRDEHVFGDSFWVLFLCFTERTVCWTRKFQCFASML